MIIIKELFEGFGSKILHYNNLVQIAKSINIEWNSVACDEYSFLGVENSFIDDNIEYIRIKTESDFISLDSELNYELMKCSGELFFKYDFPTRSIFKPKSNLVNDELINIGVHFKNDMIIDGFLDSDYYINSIKSLHNPDNKYILFSDDLDLKTFLDVQKYLSQNRYDWEFGMSIYDEFHFINDFYQLCDCDYIVSSPSTFAICAGFMGKEKQIIHSKKWVESRVEKGKDFWIEISKGGNINYKIKGLI